MLGPEGYQIGDTWVIAALHVATEKLAALGEAEGVHGGGFGEDGVASKFLADMIKLGSQVPKPGSCTVGRSVLVEMDEVGVCSPDRVIYEGCDRAQAIGFIAMIEELARYCRRAFLRAYLSPRPCQTISGKFGSVASIFTDGLEPRGLWRMSEDDAVCRKLRTKAESVVQSLMILKDRLLPLSYMPKKLVTILKQSGCLTPSSGRKSRACPLRTTSLSINPRSTSRPPSSTWIFYY